MLIFIDESGDTGYKFDKGSSTHFTICLVIFHDTAEAEKCSKAIDQLRQDFPLPERFEFHFGSNKQRVRMAFLDTVGKFKFNISPASIDKRENPLLKKNLYAYTCQQALVAIPSQSDRIALTVDKRGGIASHFALKRYIKKSPGLGRRFKSIKAQDSRKENLLQLADYCANIKHREALNKKDWQLYDRFIADKRIIIKH